MLNGLDLFSGIGGISLALRDYVRPIAYCEIDPYCHGVLLSRMADQYLLSATIWNDIRTLRGSVFRGEIEIIYGGFPCQGFSVAGIGKGLEDERSGLFFEIVRLAKEIKPKFIFLENVPAITSRGGLRVVREIAEMGYDCRWCVISADSVGALHKRERWFLLAHANDNGGYPLCFSGQQTDSPSVSLSNEEGTWGRHSRQYWPFKSREHWQKIVSKVCRTTDGVPFIVERLRALGNAVVPIQAKEAFKILMGLGEINAS